MIKTKATTLMSLSLYLCFHERLKHKANFVLIKHYHPQRSRHLCSSQAQCHLCSNYLGSSDHLIDHRRNLKSPRQSHRPPNSTHKSNLHIHKSNLHTHKSTPPLTTSTHKPIINQTPNHQHRPKSSSQTTKLHRNGFRTTPVKNLLGGEVCG
jgi:hypothetical protein